MNKVKKGAIVFELFFVSFSIYSLFVSVALFNSTETFDMIRFYVFAGMSIISSILALYIFIMLFLKKLDNY